MLPGTRHAVLTLEDSFVIGSHFYSRHTMSRTLYALTMEHYFNNISNASHPQYLVVLLKVLADCFLQCSKAPREIQENHGTPMFSLGHVLY